MGKVDDMRRQREEQAAAAEKQRAVPRPPSQHLNVGPDAPPATLEKRLRPREKARPITEATLKQEEAKGEVRKDGSGVVVQITIRRPLVQRSAQKVLHAAARAMSGGATLEDVLKALAGAQPGAPA